MKEWIGDRRGFEGRCFAAVVVFSKRNNYILSFPEGSERNDPEIEGVICLNDDPKKKKKMASSVQRQPLNKSYDIFVWLQARKYSIFWATLMVGK